MREFRALWLSVILSAAGDRLALVAIAVLVYDRTRSPLLAAVAYAAGYLPWVIGGLFLADLADRRPRRTVMVTCDVVRAVFVAAMAVPGMPVTALVLLLFAATMFASPFESARASITPGILPGERYALGTAVIQTTYLTAEVAGAAAGGAAVTVFGVRPSLLIDAATFLASGLLIGLGTRARPAAAARRPARARRWPGRPPGSGWCSATGRCGPSCCSAGWWSSTRSRRESPPRMRPGSGAARSPPGWCWRPRPPPPRSPRRCSAGSSAPGGGLR